MVLANQMPLHRHLKICDDRQRGVQQVIEVQQANPRQGTNSNTETQIEGRAKRIINKPSYLKDFV